eukprot:15336236-Ditylum_brightwellii.AAC.1
MIKLLSLVPNLLLLMSTRRNSNRDNCSYLTMVCLTWNFMIVMKWSSRVMVFVPGLYEKRLSKH